MVQLCKTITDYMATGATGAMPLLYSIRDCVSYSFEGLLIALFFLLAGGNYFLIKARTGRAKILPAILPASFLMIILSMFLALSQLVGYITVIFFAFLSIIIFILFIVSDKD